MNERCDLCNYPGHLVRLTRDSDTIVVRRCDWHQARLEEQHPGRVEQIESDDDDDDDRIGGQFR